MGRRIRAVLARDPEPRERAGRKTTQPIGGTMSTALTAPGVEDLTLSITDEIHVKASLQATFEALLEQLGPGMEGAERKPMPMTIEAWPGGRWYRDLGDGNGHLW